MLTGDAHDRPGGVADAAVVTDSFPRTFYLRSFGCQMNDHDAERIHGMLADMGVRRVEAPEEADLLVFNTCSIREKADSRLLGHLGGAKRLKQADPGRIVAVTGCLPQSRGNAFFRDHPYVDILLGPQSLHELPFQLRRKLDGETGCSSFQEHTSTFSAELSRARVEGPRAWLQIMTGCTNYCSYCIVPYVRGPEASRQPGDIVEEAERLAAEGVREITLLGQNVNAYGREPGFTGRTDFAGLLHLLAAVPGLARIRFMTSHPRDVSPELIGTMARLPTVCEHLHLPAQSGSDAILAAMRRGYTREDYLRLVDRLRESIPGLALSSDLIVGFPGETDEDFEDTLSLVERSGFHTAFTFIYSPRPRTRAIDLPGRVDRSVAEARVERLIALVQQQAEAANRALVGEEVEVLVERSSRHDPDMWMGRTRTHKTVNFRGAASPGDLLMVKVEAATSTSLRGSQGVAVNER